MKAFESLKYYVFTIRRLKQGKKFTALRHWAKTVKVGALAAFKVYQQYRKDKRRLYNQVLAERLRVMNQQLVFKISKVG